MSKYNIDQKADFPNSSRHRKTNSNCYSYITQTIYVKRKILSGFWFSEWVASCDRKLTTENHHCGCCQTSKYKFGLFFALRKRYINRLFTDSKPLFSTFLPSKEFLFYQLLECIDMQFIYKRFNMISIRRKLMNTEMLMLFHVFHYVAKIYLISLVQMM